MKTSRSFVTHEIINISRHGLSVGSLDEHSSWTHSLDAESAITMAEVPDGVTFRAQVLPQRKFGALQQDTGGVKGEAKILRSPPLSCRVLHLLGGVSNAFEHGV